MCANGLQINVERLKQNKMDLKRLQLAKECVGIVNQLYDLAEVPVEKRQAINDKADKYLLDQVLRLCTVSNCKRDETLELLEEIMVKVKEANEEVENGIYDPMLECVKHILNNYKIERK